MNLVAVVEDVDKVLRWPWWRRAGFVTVYEWRTTRDVRSEVCIASPVTAIKRLGLGFRSGVLSHLDVGKGL
ncbi:hypothetical protein HanHA300_Chr08g0275841 [Helianthus annuus]|nr:hypothetical protein HanHA300_Chr08g0275841 [Helianthus annuus]KAJ0553142.1 hypothetical protein HanHA89_Chr08g0293141 [Helianthus annuus]